jgi:import inner membrane translocase subunit TIM13
MALTSIFGSSGSSDKAAAPLSTSTSSAQSVQIKQQLQQQISQELAIANATELVNVCHTSHINAYYFSYWR